MNNHLEFYKTISINALDDYAKITGLDATPPIDFLQFKKIIGERKKVLEVGCGTGRIGRYFISEKYNYVGIDTNQEYLKYFINRIDLKGYDDIKNIDFLKMPENEKFDVVLFPWSVVGDFSKDEQAIVLMKSVSMLNGDGVAMLDNPAPGTVYNTATGFKPTRFYFDDWKDFLSKLDLSKLYKIEYTTDTNRVREITILEK